ncbi:ethanolamine ammonia-lyase [Pseudonocardia sp. EC080610-09]|uniref:ethanolamine ammonia-lyase subunit EutC n=1 Tax=unclassified Pseudonocardia TaxID=2619320 RepID=UPI0006CB3D2E|nr:MULTISPECIES: ethanolamine ammonia-lyase subunit EutC [unclassified Pseudonocardia]ALE72124.1 ethanolamine ammonia-lyase [Pseudonocardia sp. EC080625-04]ALL75410.1 ethanolamine ammonia-lyase [Pseudonocardia sp. EC080610-09]ALL82436.1 ethanolamine ammonia-lyase [Pseudonocardia sp. EC080619-01]
MTGHGGSDPLDVLRASTRARVALGRAGDALPTARLLELRAAHAAARDAVHTPLDADALADRIAGLGVPTLRAAGAPRDRAEYLTRPDLGRRLAPGVELPRGEHDVVLVVADGLSPLAVTDHAVGMLAEVLDRLGDARVAPVVVATQARVALGDEIATAVGARSVVVLIGERPGMSSVDSLGVYFTYDARRGRRDSERNCLSNIRPPHGTGYAEAATTLALLMSEAWRLKLSGVALKADPALPAG